jgi:segregation and condensation protein B
VNLEPDRLAILEALLFVAEEPLPLAKLQEILADAAPAETDASLRDLALRLENEGRGLMVQEVAGGFRLATRPDVHLWIQKLQQVKPTRLSRAALETLAIIAYRQPVTRAEVEAIRGVAVDGVLRTLLERELVRMMGRTAEAGRPMLYGTSQLFLEHFGLRELGDLPTLREINELIGITETGAEIDAPAESTQPVAVRTPLGDERGPVEESQWAAAGPAAAPESLPVDGERTRPDVDSPPVVAGPAAAAVGAAFPSDDPAGTPESGAAGACGEEPGADGQSRAPAGDASSATAGASTG